MKAITLHQPWALFVAAGWKEVETRDWYTNYRGPLAIHAGKHFTHVENRAMARILENTPAPPVLAGELVFGAIVGVCILSACIPVGMLSQQVSKLKPPFVPAHGWDVETEMGNYAPGRWAWILRDVRRIETIPTKGYRRIWNWRVPAGVVIPYGGPPGTQPGVLWRSPGT
jgi:activating signal cointegrator 1